MNQLVITGRIATDIVSNANGTVASFRIAVDGRKKDAPASFFDCKVFGSTKDALMRFKGKGDAIAINGSISQESWKDKTTDQNRSRVVVLASGVEFLGGKSKDTAQPAADETDIPW